MRINGMFVSGLIVCSFGISGSVNGGERGPEHIRCREGAVQKSTAKISVAASTLLRGSNVSAEAAASGVTLLGQVFPGQLPGSVPFANDVWGYVSPSGREYGILGLLEGTGFIEVSDPTTPIIVGYIPDAPSTWSDMKTFGHYAYNVNENGSAGDGMQVIDLDLIDEGIVTLVNNVRASGFRRAHNVALNPDSGFVYPCSTNIAFGFLAFDLNIDPVNPPLVGAWNGAACHDLQVVSYTEGPAAGKEVAYCFAGGTGVVVIDVTNKAAMTTMAVETYPTVSFCHQGWLSSDRRYLFVNDEADETGHPDITTTTTYVFDVQDPFDPLFLTSFTSGRPSIDHNLMTRGSFVFEANYTSGLRIFDAFDVNNVQQIGFFDTFPAHDAPTFNGAWGIYVDLPSGVVLISDEDGGLMIFDVSEATDSSCHSDEDCIDLNPCTIGTCEIDNTCSYAPKAMGASCSDADECTSEDRCDGAGTCVGTDINTIACSGDEVCFGEMCDLNAGLCVCASCPSVAGIIPTAEVTNRYLKFEAGTIGALIAIEVTLETMPPPFEVFEQEVRWVGEPNENGVSSLVCQPSYRDWGSLGVLSISGENVVPGATFTIRTISSQCDVSDATLFSGPELLSTSQWGDTVAEFNNQTQSFDPPNGISDFRDISALVECFKNTTKAPPLEWCDLAPGIPDQILNFSDIQRAVEAFKDFDYPFLGPQVCE